MSTVCKSVFITGAAAGIGRATAQRFADAGWCVGLADVDAAALADVRRAIGANRSHAYVLDVTDAVAFDAAVTQFVAVAGQRLDALVNNAGVLLTGDFESIPASRYARLIDINAKGVVNGCLAAFPHLRATPGARLINMASASAIYGAPAFAVYSASKFFVRGLTEALNIEWSRHGIYVCDVLPLFVATPMVANVVEKPRSVGRLGVRLTAEHIADLIFTATTRARWRCPVHWYPGGQSALLALVNKVSPAWMNRAANQLITGY